MWNITNGFLILVSYLLECHIIYFSYNPPVKSYSAAYWGWVKVLPDADLTLIRHVHEKQLCWTLCLNPLVRQWLLTEPTETASIKVQATSCFVFPPLPCPVSDLQRSLNGSVQARFLTPQFGCDQIKCWNQFDHMKSLNRNSAEQEEWIFVISSSMLTIM